MNPILVSLETFSVIFADILDCFPHSDLGCWLVGCPDVLEISEGAGVGQGLSQQGGVFVPFEEHIGHHGFQELMAIGR